MRKREITRPNTTPRQSMNYQFNTIRKKSIEALSVEYLNILAILYGGYIQDGSRLVHDYGNMTMLEAENELRIRKLMYRGDRMRKKRKLHEEHAANEQALLEQLKRASKPT